MCGNLTSVNVHNAFLSSVLGTDHDFRRHLHNIGILCHGAQNLATELDCLALFEQLFHRHGVLLVVRIALHLHGFALFADKTRGELGAHGAEHETHACHIGRLELDAAVDGHSVETGLAYSVGHVEQIRLTAETRNVHNEALFAWHHHAGRVRRTQIMISMKQLRTH